MTPKMHPGIVGEASMFEYCWGQVEVAKSFGTTATTTTTPTTHNPNAEAIERRVRIAPTVVYLACS